MGGDLLTIETQSMPGKGKLTQTGSLGDVMQESIQAAMTVVRSRAEKLGINPDFYEKKISMSMSQKVRHLKMAQVRVSPCVQRWFLV